MKKVFIAGCGYIGKRVAMLCRQAGIEVTCMVRSAEHAAELTLAGYRSIVCSLDSPLEAPLPDIGDSVLFYFVPPPGGGNVDRRARNFCAAMAQGESPQKIIYISATSVYSARDGSVVTEQSPTVPLSVMGKRRMDAENAFQEYASAVSVQIVILRVSGIYGPGRLPLMQIRQHQPLLNEEEAGPSNRIHADDLADICLAAADRGGNNEIFNVSDGHPCSLTSYFNAVCDALGEPRQSQVSQEEARKVMTPLMLSYFSETRIVDNSLMMERLGISLRYPAMLDGIKASIGTAQ